MSGLSRFKQHLYSHRTHLIDRDKDYIRDPNGFLFADGRYKTKLLPEDLPPFYIEVYLWHDTCYLDALHVKDIIYRPNFHTNHLFKDDALLISYDKPIENSEFLLHAKNWDFVMFGSSIPGFVKAVKEFSHLNTSDIEKEILRKRMWFEENYPELLS